MIYILYFTVLHINYSNNYYCNEKRNIFTKRNHNCYPYSLNQAYNSYKNLIKDYAL